MINNAAILSLVNNPNYTIIIIVYEITKYIKILLTSSKNIPSFPIETQILLYKKNMIGNNINQKKTEEKRIKLK
jgi:hypothetical protein